HQNGLRAPAGLQAKQRAAIPYQGELYVAPTAVKLELALAHAVVGIFTPRHDRQIGPGIPFTYRPHKAERGIKIWRVEIVKEQPANAALLIAVLQIKIVIAPFLKFRVDVVPKRLTEIACGGVPVHGIFFKPVVGREVKTAAKPPDRIAPGFFSSEKAHVGMAGRHIWIVRMNHQLYAPGLEAAACQFWSVGRGGSGHRVSVDVGKIDASLLKDAAVTQHAAASAATGFALPAIFLKFTAICGGQFLANLILQLQQE